jgi:hypothetical protein
MVGTYLGCRGVFTSSRFSTGVLKRWPRVGEKKPWVGFIAAGCFFAAGGDVKALSKTIVGMIYGAIVAWVALLIIAARSST